MSNLKWIQITFWVHTYNFFHRETLWIVLIRNDTEIFADWAQMRNIETVTKLSNHHRESESNNDNSVIIVNLRTEGNRNIKGINSTLTSHRLFDNFIQGLNIESILRSLHIEKQVQKLYENGVQIYFVQADAKIDP